MRRKFQLFSALALCAMVSISIDVRASEIKDIRIWNAPQRTRIVFDVSAPSKFTTTMLRKPERISIDIDGVREIFLPGKHLSLGQYMKSVRVGQHPGKVRYVLDLKRRVKLNAFALPPNATYGHRIVVDLEDAERSAAADPVAKPDGKYVVVIDPGHGGEDPGAIGANRTLEKKVVLSISKLLAQEINRVPGMKALLTRDRDYYISLRKRIDIARRHNANVFVSIHADAFTKRSAHGISVFGLSNRGASSEAARILADKENASDRLGGVQLNTEDDQLLEVQIDMISDKKRERSDNLGNRMLGELKHVGRLHGARVEHAGFAVLKSPAIPSILVETGFISNPKEERSLNSRQYQKRLAVAIKDAIVSFAKNDPTSKSAWNSTRN